jgi:type II secretory pathway component GspD/PulD (secretin)
VPLHAATEREIFGILLSENRIEQPVFEVRSHRTKVRVPVGHTVLVGGLVSERKVQIEDRVPLIGLVTESKTEIERRFLYLFVTPQLIRLR